MMIIYVANMKTALVVRYDLRESILYRKGIQNNVQNTKPNEIVLNITKL